MPNVALAHVKTHSIAMRLRCSTCSDLHQRLQDNTAQRIETRSLHLDLLSELKRINSHICSIAYPILESEGERQSHVPAPGWPRALA